MEVERVQKVSGCCSGFAQQRKLVLIMEIPHDLMYQNLMIYGSIRYLG